MVILIFLSAIYQIKGFEKIFENKTFSSDNFKVVVHLAAQAGVRYSIDNPSAYIESNLLALITLSGG